MPVEQDSNGNSTSSSKENRKILIFLHNMSSPYRIYVLYLPNTAMVRHWSSGLNGGLPFCSRVSSL